MKRRYAGAWDGRFRILEAYLSAIRAARRFIYLENQFLWATENVAALRDKLLHPPSPDFRLVVLLPSRAYSGQDDTRGQLGVLAEADEHGKHFLACTIYARSAGVTSAPVYVHAKVGIVDDQWLTVGSANLNDHSLFNDTEVNLVSCDAALARAARIQLWSEHLEASPDELQGDPVELIDSRWKPIAYEQQACPDSSRVSLMTACVSARCARMLAVAASVSCCRTAPSWTPCAAASSSTRC